MLLIIVLLTTTVLPVVHVDGAPRSEGDALIAGVPLSSSVRHPIRSDERISIQCRRCVVAVLQVEEVQVGLGTDHLIGGERGSWAWPRGCGDDELVQCLSVVVRQIQRQRLRQC